MERSPLFIQSLENGLRVLEAFNQAEQFLSLSNVAQYSGLGKPAAQRCVHTLVQIGYLEKNRQSGLFCLGTRCLDLSFCFLRAQPLVDRAMPVLLELRRECGERTNLSLFDNSTFVYAIRLHGKREYPQHSTHIGRRMPTYCTAGGRTMLALLPDEEIKDIIAGSDIQQMTANTVVDADTIFDRIIEARANGYGFVNGESAIGELVVAAAVADNTGRPIAAVHIAGSLSKWQPSEFERTFSQYVVETASHLSGSGTNRTMASTFRKGQAVA